MKKINLLVLCSAGGSTFEHILKSFSRKINFYLFVNKNCDAVKIANNYNIPLQCASEDQGELLSEEIASYAKEINADFILCFFSRILKKPLIDDIPCYNIHPSILPKYPGMGAVKKAFNNNDLLIGATLHKIDEGVDTGKVVAQHQEPVLNPNSYDDYKYRAYISKNAVADYFCSQILNYGTKAFS